MKGDDKEHEEEQNLGMLIDQDIDDEEEKAGNEDEEAMDQDEDEQQTEVLSEHNEFKERIVTLLTEHKLIDKRSSKMEIVDFLNLLSIFNKAGIHFT